MVEVLQYLLFYLTLALLISLYADLYCNHEEQTIVLIYMFFLKFFQFLYLMPLTSLLTAYNEIIHMCNVFDLCNLPYQGNDQITFSCHLYS